MEWKPLLPGLKEPESPVEKIEEYQQRSNANLLDALDEFTLDKTRKPSTDAAETETTENIEPSKKKVYSTKSSRLMPRVKAFHAFFVEYLLSSRNDYTLKNTAHCLAEYYEANMGHPDVEFVRALQRMTEYAVQEMTKSQWTVQKSRLDLRGRNIARPKRENIYNPMLDPNCVERLVKERRAVKREIDGEMRETPRKVNSRTKIDTQR